jgi:hypothetical protein
MDFDQTLDKINKVLDCKPHQKKVAYKYCRRLVDRFADSYLQTFLYGVIAGRLKADVISH